MDVGEGLRDVTQPVVHARASEVSATRTKGPRPAAGQRRRARGGTHTPVDLGLGAGFCGGAGGQRGGGGGSGDRGGVAYQRRRRRGAAEGRAPTPCSLRSSCSCSLRWVAVAGKVAGLSSTWRRRRRGQSGVGLGGGGGRGGGGAGRDEEKGDRRQWGVAARDMSRGGCSYFPSVG